METSHPEFPGTPSLKKFELGKASKQQHENRTKKKKKKDQKRESVACKAKHLT